MGVLPQGQEIIFKVQKTMSNEKIAKGKISFPTHKAHFFSFWTPLTFKAFNFLISYSFLNDLKCYRGVTFSSTNHLGTLITTEQHTKNFLGDWESAL
jgi:hypothetical protein